MTDDAAVTQGTFADFRLIKGRKICQLVIEVPIEQADQAIAALGGIPQPQSDCWVAVARLNGVARPEPKPDKEKQKWEDLKLSMQAGIRCEEPAFWRFLTERYDNNITNADHAALDVRWICQVDSRRGLNDNPSAAEKWRDLDRSYQAWLKAAE